MAARPITDNDREQVKALHAEGMSRNDIARTIKRSSSTVSKIAATFEPPLSFTRGPEVIAATEARRIDLAARRQALAETLHADAEKLRAQLWEPCTIGEFAGREGDWQTANLPRPRFADQRQIMSATATAIQQSMRLQPAEGGADAGQVRSMLGSLGEALTGAFADDPGEDGG
ncbi:helix-turn-helix domain-containing protein [Streptomyces sp. NPDC048330]|uniref:helix-turn-helix domain-containing protein n=1 Tax=Streptomyces sp. NPDC048330 TaxID=3365533 RepID=UPI0037180386